MIYPAIEIARANIKGMIAAAATAPTAIAAPFSMG